MIKDGFIALLFIIVFFTIFSISVYFVELSLLNKKLKFCKEQPKSCSVVLNEM